MNRKHAVELISIYSPTDIYANNRWVSDKYILNFLPCFFICEIVSTSPQYIFLLNKRVVGGLSVLFVLYIDFFADFLSSEAS